MSKRIQELESKRGAVRKDQAAIVEKARTENRELTGEEIGKIKSSREQEENITETLMIEQRQLGSESQREQNFSRSEQKDLSTFSYVRAINALLSGRQLDGLEGEMHQEGVKQYREAGIKCAGNFVVPGFVAQFAGTEKRDLTVTGGTNGDQGGIFVPTQVGSLIDRLRTKLLVREMGATMLGNLVGDIAFPVALPDDQASEKTELAAANESSPTFGSRNLSPHRLPVFTEYSRQLLAQTDNPSIEAFVRDDLAFQISSRMDQMAISGTGVAPYPLGILSTVGIGAVIGGDNGLAPTWGHIVGLETEIATDNADVGKLGYIMTPGMRGLLKTTKLDAGSGLFIWSVGSTELNGYKVGITTQVPSTLTKGSSIGTAEAIIFGNWADLIIGQWGGVEFLVNPYSRDTEGLIRLNAWTFYDVLVRRPQSFSAMTDALTP